MLKKEIRILGLSSAVNVKQQRSIVGTIFRGNSWLDAVLTCVIAPHEDYLPKIIRMILNSKQHPQIRAIISRGTLLPGRVRDLRVLADRTHLPVIPIIKISENISTKMKSTPLSGKLCVERNGRIVMIRAFGLNATMARATFILGCKDNLFIPEALRVAELIACQL